MSLQTLERAILAELKTVAKNPKIKMADIMEWSTGDITPQEGEVLVRLPDLRVNTCLKKELVKT